jgi:chromosome segregation ATPase
MDPSGTRQPPMQGPLQAFGNMQRALRDADKRLDALGQSQLQVATAVDGKLNKALRRMQEDNERLRKDTHDLLAELEQLTLQMYEEHTAELAASREAQSAQRSGLEALRDTQQATLEAQQAQIDALGAVVRKQQGMIDELASASAAQMAAVQGELSELGRGFSAQAAALDASRAHAAALEEKLAAQIEKRVNASELLGAASLEALDGRVEQQARTLKTVLEGHASYQDKYEQLLQWRVGADGGLQAMEQRVGTVEAGLERAREEARDGLRGAHEELRDTAAQWPEWAKAIEEAMRKLQARRTRARPWHAHRAPARMHPRMPSSDSREPTDRPCRWRWRWQAGKADSSMVDDACAALGDRIEAVSRPPPPSAHPTLAR